MAITSFIRSILLSDTNARPIARIYSLLRTGPRAILLRFGDQTVRLISGAPFVRLSRVTPQLYVGGQHYRRGWRKMQRQGITAVVNVREVHYSDGGKAPERYLHLPTHDNTPPSLDDLRVGAAFIAEEIAQGGSVYIHCGVGVGRAPTMAAAYLITTGLTIPEALDAIQKVRPFIHPTPSQKAQLERFAAEFSQNGHIDTFTGG